VRNKTSVFIIRTKSPVRRVLFFLCRSFPATTQVTDSSNKRFRLGLRSKFLTNDVIINTARFNGNWTQQGRRLESQRNTQTTLCVKIKKSSVWPAKKLNACSSC